MEQVNVAEKLTDKQQAFIDAYLSNGFNGTRAAISAGYSEQSAHAIAWENLRKPEIKSVIEQHLADAGATRERIVSELVKVAFATDLEAFECWLEGKSTVGQLKEAGIDTTTVKKLAVRPGRNGVSRSVELYDKLRAIEQLSKILAIENDGHSQRNPSGSPYGGSTDTPVDAVAFPSGAIPGVPQPGEVQGDSGGAQVGEDGDSETEACGGTDRREQDA